MNRLLRIFRLLGGRTRLRIVTLLVNAKDRLSVQDIASTMKMTHSATSHQLALLSAANILTAKKSGREVFYRMADTDEGRKGRLMMRV